MTVQVYVVGGSVRDMLLGRPPRDLDFCVTGATPADMLQLGFVQVGADFPVFLHPRTHDEFALARTERKVAAGYGGFSTSTAGVTLQEDLMRRDLTINAMAYPLDRSLQQLVADPLSAEQWASEFDVQQVIDPFAGKADLADRIFRHVGPAFAEDPLRVLRVARFQARLGPDWRIAPELQAQAAQLHAAGELAALVPERIGKEVLRAVLEPHACLLPKAFQQLSLDALGIKWQSDISMKQTQPTGPSLHEAVWACFQPSWIQSSSWIPVDTKRFAAKVDRMLSSPKGSQFDTSVQSLVVELTQMRLFNMTSAVDAAVLAFVEILDPANIRLGAWNKAKHIKTVDCPPGPAYAQALTQARVAAILAADSA